MATYSAIAARLRGHTHSTHPSETLYRNLRRTLILHNAEKSASMKVQSDKRIKDVYRNYWRQYHNAAATLSKLYAYLDRHWVRRQQDEGMPGVYAVYDLCRLRWVRDVVDADAKITPTVKATMRDGETLIDLGLEFKKPGETCGYDVEDSIPISNK